MHGGSMAADAHRIIKSRWIMALSCDLSAVEKQSFLIFECFVLGDRAEA